MATNVFQGPAGLTLDGKGRCAMPTRHRDVLAAMDCRQLTMTKHKDHAVWIFPRPAWEVFRDEVAALPMEANDWKRFFLGNAVEFELDGQSRFLLPPELRAWAGLEREALMVGMGSTVELWDAQRHAANEEALVKTPMPESLKNLKF